MKQTVQDTSDVEYTYANNAKASIASIYFKSSYLCSALRHLLRKSTKKTMIRWPFSIITFICIYIYVKLKSVLSWTIKKLNFGNIMTAKLAMIVNINIICTNCCGLPIEIQTCITGRF